MRKFSVLLMVLALTSMAACDKTSLQAPEETGDDTSAPSGEVGSDERGNDHETPIKTENEDS